MPLFFFHVLVAMLLYLISFPMLVQAMQPQGHYTGSQSCRPCHERFYKLWEPSFHGKAMQPYTESFVATELTPQTKSISIGGSTFVVAIGKGQGYVLEKGPEGEKKHHIQHVVGGKNVYYFLTHLERGRLQTLPLAYDVNQKRWFDTAKSGVRHAGDLPVDWRDASFTFNTSCQGCHVSQFSLNYDLETDSYDTMWREPGVNCESCHGPGEEHIRECQEAPKGTVPKDLKTTVVSQRRGFKPELVNATCSGCHAKAIPLTRQFVPGDSFWDHYDIALLEHPDYYPDGRDLGENYTYTSWLMSPCLSGGKLDCLHCHTSSGRFRQKKEPNKSCLPCHEKRVLNSSAHSRHKLGSKGDRCISCHMPMTKFAQMNRSDHSMRPPAPAATIRFGSSNACNNCHTEKSAQWADSLVREWHKRDYQADVIYQADLIQAARNEDWSHLPSILSALKNEKNSVVFLTSLLRLLRHCPDPETVNAYRYAMRSQSPLVRSAGAEGMAGFVSSKPDATLVALLDDPYKLVRIRAARALASYPVEAFSLEENVKREIVTQEMLVALMARPDIWSAHFNTGNYYFRKNDLSKALVAYETGLRLEPNAPILLVNAAMVNVRLDRMEEAEHLLERAVKNAPENSIALFNLGLLKIEKGRIGRAEELLRAAYKADSSMDKAASNLAAIIYKRDIHEAISFARRAYALNPSRTNALTLAFYLQVSGNEKEARVISNNVFENRKKEALGL